ncbi:hypothetical protein D3C81_1711380 [compost metagenome]
MKQRPQLAQVVFQRRAAEAQALTRIQFARGLGGFAVRILDVLRFIQYQHMQRLLGQTFDVFWQQGVGGEDQVEVGQVIEMLFASGAIQGNHFQLRRKVRRLIEPVRNQAGRHHDHARTIEASGDFLAENMRQGL